MAATADRLPTGDVTFLFTDIEGSTRLLEALGSAYGDVIERHHAVLRDAADDHDGVGVGTEGDAFFIVFRSAADAVRCAVGAQRMLAEPSWPGAVDVRVRMGAHTGEGILGGDDYAGLDVHRAARIAASAHGGQIVVSDPTRVLAAGAGLDGVGFRDLGEHRLRDISRPEHLFQVTADGLPDAFPPIRTLAVPSHLPVQLTSFVGRETELTEARALLDGGVRLLSLTGPGGTGKTRLALELASASVERFPDGVFFVDLSTVGDASLVTPTIARALGLVDQPGRPVIDVLGGHLRDRAALLIVDNFEQVASAAGVVGDLLRRAPRIVVVATSRGPLHVSGEREFAVPPLDVPDPDRGLTTELAVRSAAVALFVERAVAARPGFQLTDGNVAHVAAICARLDGLPLAIELAAARVRLLSPAAILARLEHSLDLLDSGARDLPPRQRTLRGAIAWSHDLLDVAAQRLFARMSVFAGGALLEEIEAVCGPRDDLGGDALDGLGELVDHGLVRRLEQHDEPRFAMLRTVREFAAERRAAAGEDGPMLRRHADTYLALFERAAPQLTGVEQRDWLDRVEHEHDNLRAAIEWAMASDETDLALRLVAAPWRFWQMRGHLVEGRDRIAAAIALPDSGDHPAELARALGAAGGIAYWLGDYPATARQYRRALAIARGLDDPRLLAGALTDASVMGLEDEGLYDPASMADAAKVGLALLDEALAIYRDLDDARGEAEVLWTLGTAYTYLDDTVAAERYLLQGAEVARASGDLFHASWATYMLSWNASAQDDEARALGLARDALRMFSSVRDLTGMMLALDEVGRLRVLAGDVAGGLRLAGAVEAFERRHGSEYLPAQRRVADRPDPAASAASDPALGAAWAEGQALELDEAVALALASGD